MIYAILDRKNHGFRNIVQILDIDDDFSSIEELKAIIGEVDFNWSDIKADTENTGFNNQRFNVSTSSFEDIPKPRKPEITKLELIQRLTSQEQAMLWFPEDIGSLPDNAKMMLKLFAKQIDIANYINLDRPDTVVGLNQLEAAGLLAQGRAQQIRGIDELPS